jgi:glutaconate CoA-transferase subunit B
MTESAATGSVPEYTRDEQMIVEAARQLQSGQSCFVGIGMPSTAANLARLTHAPGVILIYESGCIGAKPSVLPLSIGGAELAETADAVVSVPEIFTYWLQGGRIAVGFLGAAQIDRFANINTTVVIGGGSYLKPKVRLPGAGGASEIATCCGEVFIMLRQSKRSFVDKLDFITSAGHMDGGDARERLGLPGRGPTRVITDLGVLEPDAVTRELVLTRIHAGVSVDEVRAATGWPLKVSANLRTTEAPTHHYLDTMRDLQDRSARAHAGGA